MPHTSCATTGTHLCEPKLVCDLLGALTASSAGALAGESCCASLAPRTSCVAADRGAWRHRTGYTFGWLCSLSTTAHYFGALATYLPPALRGGCCCAALSKGGRCAADAVACDSSVGITVGVPFSPAPPLPLALPLPPPPPLPLPLTPPSSARAHCTANLSRVPSHQPPREPSVDPRVPGGRHTTRAARSTRSQTTAP